jgi:hypothetical protein
MLFSASVMVNKQRLDGLAGLSHVPVEVNACSH